MIRAFQPLPDLLHPFLHLFYRHQHQKNYAVISSSVLPDMSTDNIKNSLMDRISKTYPGFTASR
jgi:F0F1-type ATP synthase delta subunit